MYTDSDVYFKYMDNHKYHCRDTPKGTMCQFGNTIDGNLIKLGDTTKVSEIFNIDCDNSAHIYGNVYLIGDWTLEGNATFPKEENVVYIDGLHLKKGA